MHYLEFAKGLWSAGRRVCAEVRQTELEGVDDEAQEFGARLALCLRGAREGGVAGLHYVEVLPYPLPHPVCRDLAHVVHPRRPKLVSQRWRAHKHGKQLPEEHIQTFAGRIRPEHPGAHLGQHAVGKQKDRQLGQLQIYWAVQCVVESPLNLGGARPEAIHEGGVALEDLRECT